MNALFTKIKQLDPMPAVAHVLTFAVAFMLGQQSTNHEIKNHYIIDAGKVEVMYHDPYKALTLSECTTDYECNIAQLLDDQANGRFVSTDDPIFFPDSIPVVEPIDCETGDKECEKANKQNAGKPAHYPAICEPYIFPNELSEKNPLTNGDHQ